MTSEVLEEKCRQVAQWLLAARHAVAFTGAGISTESGIPDFRSADGIWSRYRVIYFDEFLDSVEARYEYWRQKAELYRECRDCRPNRGHQVLADWERAGLLRCVLTQNVDGLHQDAGSKNVIELHGTGRLVGCLRCGARFDAEPYVLRFLDEDRVPDCPECGGLLKHAVISFGQQLEPQVMETALCHARQADLMLVVGSSLVVEPAASLPRMVAGNGGRLVIINRDPTPQDSLARCVLRGESGPILDSIERWRQRLATSISTS
ncbi:MAG: NAD-dependent protein deacetylase [Pirellulaceae bacterium]|nr:MAG: NAD-dependent protein deacetylase [Pirellulaceae bacterium]